ncbi:NLR family CARD domain-containing protein 4-like [Antedon mediterranea]|uniref:NLR family CARD domain-containing protein 4-like n=1 Tax=Antedon mediterranea TaxID=105859 RepID=UPI003AF90D7D
MCCYRFIVNNIQKVEVYLLDKQQTVLQYAKCFTPAILNPRYQVDISELFTDLELLKHSKRTSISQPTTIKDVLSFIKSKPACRVLVDGEGGIGKTTLLRYISYNAATDESVDVFKGKIVFLLNVRDLEEGKGILNLIVKQLDMEEFDLKTELGDDSKIIKKFILNHDDKIVLLLDGLDELRFKSNTLIELFRKEKLKNSTVILTSRSENINEFINSCDVYVRVKGFGNDSIENYISKHFEHFETPALGESLKQELLHQNYHKEIHSMCKNPMLLLSICFMWEDKQNLPEDESDLFKELFRSILNQFIAKQPQQQNNLLSKFDAAPVEYVNPMICLGECMYHSLKINQLSINKQKMIGDKNMVDMALKLGFVYEDALV